MEKDYIHIILADDDEDDRMFFSDAFEELKINTKVQTCNDGVELMKYLNNEDSILPHVLFLDLNMPMKNGIECLDEIKARFDKENAPLRNKLNAIKLNAIFDFLDKIRALFWVYFSPEAESKMLNGFPSILSRALTKTSTFITIPRPPP